jgi:diaminohydroxyphosphoribosylaminopyrimidine deaminase/5-amino-6-(5-phosphoribosylamino)uracil reductase
VQDAAVHRHPRGVLHLPGHDPHAALEALAAEGIRTVFVEGGPTVASAFIAAGLVDEVLAYVAPVLLGGPRVALGDIGVGSMHERLRLDVLSTTSLGPDLLVRARPAAAVPAQPGPVHAEDGARTDRSTT